MDIREKWAGLSMVEINASKWFNQYKVKLNEIHIFNYILTIPSINTKQKHHIKTKINKNDSNSDSKLSGENCNSLTQIWKNVSQS